MKKLLVLLALCMVLTVALVACEKNPGTTDESTAGTTEAPTTDAPTTEEPTTEPGTTDTTEPGTTDTTEPGTTDTTDTTTPPPPPADPVKSHLSFDECDPWVGETQGTGFFTPGQSTSWDLIANVEDYNVSAIRIWGWVAWYNETPGVYGYQIGDADPVFDDAFTVEAEQGVIDAALTMGGKSGTRMKIMIPVEYVGGEGIVIKALAKDVHGTVETLVEFTLNKTANPNAPAAFVPAADMASSIPGSPGVNGAELSADGKYVTIDTIGQGDPYYQLPMLNAKGTVGAFVAIKYRSTSTHTRSEMFVGSGAGPSGQGDNVQFDLVCDGKWNLAIIDLAQVSAVADGVINYLRWDPFAGAADATIDLGYIGVFQSAEAALAYDAQFKGDFIDILNTSMDSWTVSGHAPGLTGSDSPDKGGMIAAGGLEKGALLHQGSIGLGELNLAQFSKMIVYYGIDNSQVTIDHWTASANNRVMITKVDTDMTNSPADENIVASAGYELKGWSLVAVEIDLTGVDYAGPVFVSYDTLPGTFMLIGKIELVYDANYVAPEAPAEDPFYALKMTQAKEGVDYYFTGEMAGEYLATSANPADAAKVYVEASENGLRQYVLIDGVKNYIEIHKNDEGKVRVWLTTEPTQYYVFSEEANTYVINFEENSYYLGTYGDWNTIGTSKISYITGDNAANVGVSQYVVEWVDYPTVETPEEPEEYTGKWHASVDSFMYCVNADFSDVVDFTQAATNNINGTTITSGTGSLPSVTANFIYLANGWLAVDGYSLENFACNVYAADGTLLKTFDLTLRDAEQGVLDHVANNMTYAGVPNRIGQNDAEIINLSEYTGQTLTVVYTVDAVDTNYTINLINLEVIVP